MLLAQPEENKRSANKACVALIRPAKCLLDLACVAFPGVVGAMPSGLGHIAAEQITDRALPAAPRVLVGRTHSRRAPLRRPFSKRPLRVRNGRPPPHPIRARGPVHGL